MMEMADILCCVTSIVQGASLCKCHVSSNTSLSRLSLTARHRWGSQCCALAAAWPLLVVSLLQEADVSSQARTEPVELSYQEVAMPPVG